MRDREYMQLAIELAKKGLGFTSPNPLVGAVIVKDGKIIGQGYHEKYGEPHAERNALASCSESPKGAAMYVTLEPCCHHGKQPPCVEAVLEAGISHVIVGSGDPNPLVAGKGIEILRSNGVKVTENFMKEECDSINGVFFHYIRTKKPYVVMKYAMTLDGKIAAYTGESKWVTGEKAREHVQNLRHRYTGIMVGVGTVLSDNPMLTCRIEGLKSPIRIICDSKLRTPLGSNVVITAKAATTIIATCSVDDNKKCAYEKAGCKIITVNEKEGHIDLNELMVALGKEGIDSILIEGGGTLNWSVIKDGLVDKVYAYIAPKLFGGETAKTPVEGVGFESPDVSIKLKNSSIERLGDDLLVEGEVDKNVYRNN